MKRIKPKVNQGKKIKGTENLFNFVAELNNGGCGETNGAVATFSTLMTMMNDKLKEEIRKTNEVLKNGGVILYPTDTIWGLGCDATNEEAVKRIYEIKKRADNKSMIILLDDAGKIASYASVPNVALDLIEVADKPTTIIYPDAKRLAPNLIAEDGTVGIRITNEEFSKSLIFRFHKPIVSTSANISGEPSPHFFGEISEEIKNAVDYIVDFRRNETKAAAPSSIIKLGMGGEIQIIRK